MSTERAEFLQAILDDPDDDAPRLQFADWLEENDGNETCQACNGSGYRGITLADVAKTLYRTRRDGRTEAYLESKPFDPTPPPKCSECNGDRGFPNFFKERAEFIRVQCEFVSLIDRIDTYPARSDKNNQWGIGLRDPKLKWLYNQLELIRARSGELLRTNIVAWTESLPAVFRTEVCPLRGIVPNYGRIAFCRGFVETLTCASYDWLDHGDAILAEHPIEQVRFTTPLVAYLPHFLEGPIGRVVCKRGDGAMLTEFVFNPQQGPPTVDNVAFLQGITNEDVIIGCYRGRWPRIKRWAFPSNDYSRPGLLMGRVSASGEFQG